MNPLYQQSQQELLRRFNEFQRTFKGDPQQMVQQMLNRGQITQAQYNAAVQKANQLLQIMKK